MADPRMQPFNLVGEDIAAAEAAAVTFLQVCRRAADVQFAGRPTEQIGHLPPDATVVGRSVFSIAVQGMFNAREAEGVKVSAFDMFDGFAHGLATLIAQAPESSRDAVLSLIFNNLQGYEKRTRAALTRKGPLNG